MSRLSAVVSGIAWFALGLVYGFGATLGHHATAAVAGVTVPWGLVASILGSLGLLICVRLLATWHMAAAWVAMGLISSVSLLATGIGGSSILITADVIGLIWMFAPVVLGLLVVLWPAGRLSRGETES